jgi:CBS domain-containing protein
MGNKGSKSSPPQNKKQASPHSAIRNSSVLTRSTRSPSDPKKKVHISTDNEHDVSDEPPASVSSTNWKKILSSPVKDFDAPPIECIDDTATAHDCLQKLKDLGYRSIPVVDANNKCIGLVDLLDMSALLLQIFYEDYPKPNFQDGEHLKKVLEKVRKSFFKTPIKQIMNLSKRNEYKPVTADILFGNEEVLGRLASGAHRIPVIDGNKQVINYITQGRVMELIAENINNFRNKMDKTVTNLGLGLREVVTVNEDQTAIEAFIKMHQNKVSGIAVVDSEKKLIGSLSVSDLKYILVDEIFYGLAESAMDFVAFCRQQNVHEFSPSISVDKSTSLERIIGKFAKTHVQRLFIIDENKLPIGVFSLTEVLKATTS